MTEPGEDRPAPEEGAPVLGTWNRLYAVVVAGLMLCIALFWLFGKAFS